jgi:alkaline phosphatase
VLLIGDGMGEEHVRMIEMFGDRIQDGYSFQKCPYTTVTTLPANTNDITDSAASGTAIATGEKVNNSVVSVKIPGDGQDLETMLEQFQEEGKSTGLVTTTEVSHATPAVFAAHSTSRDNETEILEDYFTQSLPTVIMGGTVAEAEELAQAASYTIVSTREELLALDTENAQKTLGMFGQEGHFPYLLDRDTSIPGLLEMTKTTVSILDNDPDGFFLMIEGGRIDHASHDNDETKAIYELQEFIDVSEYIYDWAQTQENTLVIVTADHETGGLAITSSLQSYVAGTVPEVTWSSGSHTSTPVPLYVCAPDEDKIDLTNTKTNADIYRLVMGY